MSEAKSHPKPLISAILFTFWPDESQYIEACLKTISWVDEIIVIDNGTSPETLKIIQKYTTSIHKTDSKDFSERHNLGKSLAQGKWLLYIDSDERVSFSLKKGIQTAINNEEYAAYQLWRLPFFLGKEVKYGDRSPDYVTRLFNKEKLLTWSGEIHESSKANGQIARLKGPLYHLTHRNIFDMVAKTINFSEHEAKLRFQANHPPIVWWRLIRVILTEFYTRIIKYQGYRQGTEGWIDGLFQTFSLFIVYARLWELQRKPSLEKTYDLIDEKIIAEFV